MVSVVAGAHFLWCPLLQQIREGRGAHMVGCHRFAAKTRGCAGDARARSDSGIAIRSPAAKDPDLISGLRGFNPGRARFQGNCVCLLFVCLLLACCLLLLVFCWLFVSSSSRGATLRSRAERHRYVLCFRHASVTLPLRFRYISVTFPWCASPWPLPGASAKEATIREQS